MPTTPEDEGTIRKYLGDDFPTQADDIVRIAMNLLGQYDSLDWQTAAILAMNYSDAMGKLKITEDDITVALQDSKKRKWLREVSIANGEEGSKNLANIFGLYDLCIRKE